jgi:hypothetical protein
MIQPEGDPELMYEYTHRSDEKLWLGSEASFLLGGVPHTQRRDYARLLPTPCGNI